MKLSELVLQHLTELMNWPQNMSIGTKGSTTYADDQNMTVLAFRILQSCAFSCWVGDLEEKGRRFTHLDLLCCGF
jgi:hypothetical protein